jgi:hypothetical protein
VTYTVVFTSPSSGTVQVFSGVDTGDLEMTTANNPSQASLAVNAANAPNVPIPTVPWWLIALMLAALGAARSRKTH